MRPAPSAVPVIDLSAYYDPAATPDARRRLAQEIDRACCEIGFLVIAGHRVPPSTLQAAFAAAFRFFDSPDALKRSAIPSDERVRGYEPMGRQALARSLEQESPTDLFERFRFGAFGFPDDDYHASRANGWFAPNIWPDGPAGFRWALEAYYRAMESLAGDLMRLFAMALDLPEQYFDKSIDRHISSLCINHYPAPVGEPAPGQLRAGAHTDYGSLTIVAPTPAAGRLQVMTRSGVWTEIEPGPGELVVNLGDLMAQWTNNRWVSTLHRVGNPDPSEAGVSRRMSLVFFHQPNDDALIECIPTCLAAGAVPSFAPATSGEHLRMKINRTFEPIDPPQSSSAIPSTVG